MKIPRVWECCKEWGQLASQGTFQAGLGNGPEGAGRGGGNSSVPPWGSSQPAPSPFLATPSPNPGKRHLMGLEDIIKKEEGIIMWDFGDLGPHSGSAVTLSRSPSLSEPLFLQEFA